MDWQELISLLIVAIAAAALLWGKFRPRKFNFQRDTHCGCSSAGESGSGTSIVFHARKGERPEVRMKMK